MQEWGGERELWMRQARAQLMSRELREAEKRVGWERRHCTWGWGRVLSKREMYVGERSIAEVEPQLKKNINMATHLEIQTLGR